jgi:hypothetical protein
MTRQRVTDQPLDPMLSPLDMSLAPIAWSGWTDVQMTKPPAG